MLSSSLNHVSWQEEVRNAFKKTSELEKFLEYPIPHLKDYSLFIPRSFAKRIKDAGRDSVLSKQFLPNLDEESSHFQENGLYDPIGDKAHAKGGQLVHRYKNRALFTPTTKCPVHCRYCFRKNELNTSDDIFRPDFEKTLEYLLAHPEINEIIFSGGDPLFLSNKKIDSYLKAFSQIPSIRYIRFHTRFPIILPTRLDEKFHQIIKKYTFHFSKILFVLHTNHAQEISREVADKIQHSSLHWLSQTVLLKGVNDNKKDLLELFYLLDELGVRPYYLHHPDHVKGAMHFYLSLEAGRRLYHSLRSELPGWLLPQYILDIPGGFGKTPASNPESFTYSGTLIDQKGQNQGILL